jgi:hypothetical protein
MFLLLLIHTPIFLPGIYTMGFTLCSLTFQVRNIMDNKSNNNCDRSGPQIMEHRPNSKSDTSADIIRAESPIRSLTEHYVLNRAINQWDGPK